MDVKKIYYYVKKKKEKFSDIFVGVSIMNGQMMEKTHDVS